MEIVTLNLADLTPSYSNAAPAAPRRCYMMELDPHYCDVILQRWEQFTGKEAVKIGQGTMAAEDQDGLQKGGDL